MRPIRLLTGLLAASAVSGCAAVQPMPLHAGVPQPDISKKGIAVLRVKVRNDNRPSQQPELWFLSGGQGEKKLSWTTPALIGDAGKQGKDYFASMDVEPGGLDIKTLWFSRRVFPLLNATAIAHIDSQVQVPAGKIVYLGSLDAVIISSPQISSKPKAGELLPLIDQKVAGFSDGEWQLTVKDDFDADVAELKTRFPFLSGAEFVKSLLKLPEEAPAAPAAPAEPAAKPAA